MDLFIQQTRLGFNVSDDLDLNFKLKISLNQAIDFFHMLQRQRNNELVPTEIASCLLPMPVSKRDCEYE